MVEPGADGVKIQGNFLGTDITGSLGLGVGDAGLQLRSSNTLVGGPAAADRNVISGNDGRGLVTFTFGPIATGNVVQNNYIGTDATGLKSVLTRQRVFKFTIKTECRSSTMSSRGSAPWNLALRINDSCKYSHPRELHRRGCGWRQPAGQHGDRHLGGVVIVNSTVCQPWPGKPMSSLSMRWMEFAWTPALAHPSEVTRSMAMASWGITRGVDGVDVNDAGDGDTGPRQPGQFSCANSSCCQRQQSDRHRIVPWHG